MKKVLFLMHDLCGGGAEKVLVNTVNHLNPSEFDVHVIALFGGGVNEKNLLPHVHYKALFNKTIPGNSKIMKYLNSDLLHRMIIKESYDIEIAFLEGSISKIISGCKNPKTKLISWIHTDQRNYKKGAIGYFKNEQEAISTYGRFDCIVSVSETVKNRFQKNFPKAKEPIVLYNVLETEKVKTMALDKDIDVCFSNEEIKIIAVGKIDKRKGIDRLARIIFRLRKDGYPVHMYAIGSGDSQNEIERFIKDNNMEHYFTFLGYQTNPYKYLAHCDLYVCASLQEGFSTATTEAIIIGIPVCTVEVSGMKEMLGDDNEWGLITENNEDALYEGIKKLLSDKNLLDKYKLKAIERGKYFSMEKAIAAVEDLLLTL